MIWHIHQLVVGIHIFLAIVWAGGILFVGWGVYPAANSLKPPARRQFLHTMMSKTHWLFTLAGLGVITTGVLLGTLLGPLHQWKDVWNTHYGNIWLTALVIAFGTLAWGILMGYRLTMLMLSDDILWQRAESGNQKPLADRMKFITALESIEVMGFIAILICMILLR